MAKYLNFNLQSFEVVFSFLRKKFEVVFSFLRKKKSQ